MYPSHLRSTAAMLTALAALAAVPLAAQGPASTGLVAPGAADPSWTVSLGSGPFGTAFRVTSPPGSWIDAGGPQAARWISFAPSATGAGSPYVFRATFDLTGYDPTTASLTFRCSVDNFFGSIALNGAVVSGATCPGFTQWSASQVIASGYQAGINTLDFAFSGDGTTDGLIVDVQAFTVSPTAVVPEPSTVLLLATGIGGLAAATRRRRRR